MEAPVKPGARAEPPEGDGIARPVTGRRQVAVSAAGDGAYTGKPASHGATPAYRILLHFDGARYIADVPEIANCRGAGASYAEAVQAAEVAIASALARRSCTDGKAPRLLAPADFAKTVEQCLASAEAHLSQSRRTRKRRSSPVKLALVAKYGWMSNRALANRIGLMTRDAPTMLSLAAGGKGTRHTRCIIALALEELPSRLWPDRLAEVCQKDDALYFTCRQRGC